MHLDLFPRYKAYLLECRHHAKQRALMAKFRIRHGETTKEGRSYDPCDVVTADCCNALWVSSLLPGEVWNNLRH